MQPTLGRIVHYVLPAGPNAGQGRPAVVVDVAPDGETCFLQVFTKGAEDNLLNPPCDGVLSSAVGHNVLCVSRARYAEGHVADPAAGTVRYEPGTWHWPPRG